MVGSRLKRQCARLSQEDDADAVRTSATAAQRTR